MIILIAVISGILIGSWIWLTTHEQLFSVH